VQGCFRNPRLRRERGRRPDGLRSSAQPLNRQDRRHAIHSRDGLERQHSFGNSTLMRSVLLVALAIASSPALSKTPNEFARYSVRVFSGPLKFPSEDKWPDANWREDAHTAINFGGHFTFLTLSCGISCSSDWIIDRKTGQMIRAPEGGADVQSFRVDTRPNSNLMKMLSVSSRNDGSGDIFPPCFSQNFVWTGKAFHPLSKRIETKCPSEVTR